MDYVQRNTGMLSGESISMKQFKRHIDLIRYAVRRAIHRVDVLEPEACIEQAEEHTKKHNWLQWAQQKLRGGR